VTPRRVAIVSAQLLGVEHGSGGVGAATAFLALALARMGHDVRVLYIKEELPRPMDAEWACRYADAGVAIRHLPPPEVPVEPARFTRLRRVELALRADPPDVVIAHEYGGPAYFAQRLRRLGLAFKDTVFVTYCHGTGPWIKEVTGNVRIRPEMIAHTPLEQAAVELADVVVSPSGYMLEWMREKGWRLPPDARVIPLVTQATAMGGPPSGPVETDGDRPVERLVFFGRLQKLKGVELFVRGLNALPPDLLEGVEVEFLGPASDSNPERLARLLSERTTRALQGLSFETGLDQGQALARLSAPGTLAVIPSLAENSPNVVYECLEGRIPFLASAVGGIGELVAAEDRARVLFEPTADGIAAALQRALVERGSLRPVRPAFDGAAVLRAWKDVLETQGRSVERELDRPAVDLVVEEPGRAGAQTYERLNVIRAATREEGLQAGTADWVIFLDGDDMPEPDLVDVLVRSQAASGADVVSCALRRPECEHFFVGEPGAAGLLENGYGTVALLRRSLLGAVDGDDWPLLARLNAAGARVVSVPLPLVARTDSPGTLEQSPDDALRVVDAFEAALPPQLRPLARLAAGLAAGQHSSPSRAEQGVSIRFKRLARRVRQGVRDSSAAIPAARRAAPRSGSGKTRSNS
jgi:O-antigen biosynthesis protein